jgi:hypothetical protein
MNGLVHRLSQPEFGHPVQASDDFCALLFPSPVVCVASHRQSWPRRALSLSRLPCRVGERLQDDTTVHVVFTGTRGGTSLGCLADRAASTLAGADTGEHILLVSKVKKLNGHPIKLHARLDMRTLMGEHR